MVRRGAWLLKSAAILLFLFSFLMSCDESDNGSEPQDVKITLNRKVVSFEPGEQFLKIEATINWEVRIEYKVGQGDATQWCSIDGEQQATGNGSRDLIIKYSGNSGEQSRELIFVLSIAGEDITLARLKQKAEGDGELVGPDPEVVGWLELPAQSNREDAVSVTHFADFTFGNKRNFSILYDTVELISYWVAYPLHKVHLNEKNKARYDKWGYDTKIASYWQPDYRKSGMPGYDRGHQLPSADRPNNTKYSSDVTSNPHYQNCFSTNLTPQNSTLNQQFWAHLEIAIRENWLSADTLFVVTGAILERANLTSGESDPVTYITKFDKKIARPNYYYKVLLKGNSTNGYTAIGFWVPHVATTGSNFVQYAKSVREIEELTGFDFFAGLKKETQEQIEVAYVRGDWAGL